MVYPEPLNLSDVARLKIERFDFAPMVADRLERVRANPADAAALMDLSLALQMMGFKDEGVETLRLALRLSRIYRFPSDTPERLRVLVFVTEGEIGANAPIEFLIEDIGVTLYKLYLGGPFDPELIPPHDVAFTVMGQDPRAQAAFNHAIELYGSWPRPVLNDPQKILGLERTRLYQAFEDEPAVAIPPTIDVSRADLSHCLGTQADIATLHPDLAYPLIIRPVGSHMGDALARIDDAQQLEDYLAKIDAAQLYVSNFVDFSDADGFFRKLRIAFIGGRPFLCHKAISTRWIVHYANADMAVHEWRRREEQLAMESFDSDFAVRHAASLEAIVRCVGLDYFSIDCAELSDGRLLLFEADVAGIVHGLDPASLYPYKQVQMAKIFEAFHRFLEGFRQG